MNKELIERMMTSREVEVTLLVITPPSSLHIPQSTSSAICLTVGRAGTICSIGWASSPRNRLRADKNGRKRVETALRAPNLRQSTTTKSHLRSLWTAHSSPRSHGGYTS